MRTVRRRTAALLVLSGSNPTHPHGSRFFLRPDSAQTPTSGRDVSAAYWLRIFEAINADIEHLGMERSATPNHSPASHIQRCQLAWRPAAHRAMRKFRAAWPPVAMGQTVLDRAAEVQDALADRRQHCGAKIAGLLIAAAADAAGLVVLHHDHDFDLIASVTGQPVEWIVPAGTVACQTHHRARATESAYQSGRRL